MSAPERVIWRRVVLGCAQRLRVAARALRDLAASSTPDARTEWERRLLDYFDFAQAASYLTSLRHPIPAFQVSHSEKIQEALSVAAIVVYAKPFTRQRDRFQRNEPRRYLRFYERMLDKESLELAPKANDEAPERSLHRRIMSLRHQFTAHSDAVAARIDPSDDFRTVTRQVGTLAQEDARQLRLLALKLQALAGDRLDELAGQLAPGAGGAAPDSTPSSSD